MFSKAYIPYRGYYTSPFVRYGKSFKDYNSIELSATTTKEWMGHNKIDPSIIDFVLYGTSVHQHRGFWAGPWAAALIGASHTTGAMLSQACTTAATALYQAAANTELGLCRTTYCLVSDRTSNGPIINWPEYDITEDWVNDNFEYDPWGKTSMLQTAENVVTFNNISRQQLDDVTAHRYAQYNTIVEKPYMFKTADVVNDQGVKQVDIKRLTRLKSINPNSVHTLGNVTYPADGHCGIIVTDINTAMLFSDIKIQILSYGYSRCDTSFMPLASITATSMALKKANLSISDMTVINQHNAFVVNDIAFANYFGNDVYNMNNYGSPLVYGHPQSPVLGRLAIEGIEECINKGGGYVLVTGAAGGDTGAALILKVN